MPTFIAIGCSRQHLPHARDPWPRDGRLHQHHDHRAPIAAAAGPSRLRHRAHGRLGGARARHRSGRDPAAQLHSGRRRCPTQTPLGLTYDCGDFLKNMEDAARAADYAGLAARRAEARARGKLRGVGVVQYHRAGGRARFEHAEVRFDPSGGGDPLLPAPSTTARATHDLQADRRDRLGLDPPDPLPPGRHRRRGDGRRHRRLALGVLCGGASASPPTGSSTRRSRSRPMSSRRRGRHRLRGGPLRGRRAPTAAISHRRGRPPAPSSARPARRDRARPDAPARIFRHRADLAERLPYLRGRDRPRDRRRRADALCRGRRCRDGAQPAAGGRPDHGGIAQGVGQVLMEDIVYDEDPASSSPARSWTTACRAPTISASSSCMRTRCRRQPTRSASRAPARPARVGALPAVADAIIDALACRCGTGIDMPATPENVWRAIAAARGEA